MNVDPLDHFTDEEIWRAIDSAHLKAFLKRENQGLEYDCGEAGQNFRCFGKMCLYIFVE